MKAPANRQNARGKRTTTITDCFDNIDIRPVLGSYPIHDHRQLVLFSMERMVLVTY